MALCSACLVIEAVELGLIRRICTFETLRRCPVAARFDRIGNGGRLQLELAVRRDVVVGGKPSDGLVVVGIDVAALGVQAIAPDMHVDNLFQHQHAARLISAKDGGQRRSFVSKATDYRSGSSDVMVRPRKLLSDCYGPNAGTFNVLKCAISRR